MTLAGEVDPEYIVSVVNVTPQTLEAMIAHLRASTTFVHHVYRESELDAVWSLLGFAVASAQTEGERARLSQCRQIAHEAHDLVGAGAAAEAATCLSEIFAYLR